MQRTAPEFTLESTSGRPLTKQDLRGSYAVLVFYPANDTPICNKQLSEMNEGLEEFSINGVRLFGVNTSSVEAHKGFCERRRLDFPILSDPGGNVARQYGAAFPFLPIIRRTVVALAPDGNICFYEHGKPLPEKVLAAICLHKGESSA